MSTDQVAGRLIQRRLKLRGLEVRPDALRAIQSVLGGETNPSAALDRIIGCLKEKIAAGSVATCIVDRRHVAEAVLELSKNDDDIISESITVWDAFRIPYSTYSSTTRSFQIASKSGAQEAGALLHGDPETKTRLLRERFSFVHQRVMRHHLFAHRLVGASDSGEAAVTLTPIEALAAGGGDPTHLHHVMGVLTRVDEDNLWLEDLNGKLPVDIRPDEVVCGQGLFTVGCVVIAAGYLLNSSQEEDEGVENSSQQQARRRRGNKGSVLRVTALMMPPKESRKDTERAHPGAARRLLGLPELSQKDLRSMREMEEESDETFFLMMSDVHLDDPDTMRTLKRVFEGFAQFPPQLIVLMGNFSRRPFGFGNRATASNDQVSAQEFGDMFESLAALMLQYPTLLGPETRWVLVPGPRDPSPSPKEILPRPCIPRGICERLTDRLPETCRVTFTSNPTRIMFYNQEICFFRNDTMSKMRRHCVIPPSSDNQKASEDLVSTLCNQGHLCPVTLDSRPIYCAYERSLRLFPLPDVVVLADHYEQYQWKFDDCQMLNPGSFSSDGSFVVYRPATEQTEFSRVPRGGGKEDAPNSNAHDD